jgi:peptide-N4-(N-acetyl-beta-glucosaminyl)asparagine amidase
MILIGEVKPNDYEIKEFSSQIVEEYYCEECDHDTRFPRVLNTYQLLKSRIGKCGEWAMGFGALVAALGHEVRLLEDLTDHFYIEYYDN